MIKLLPLAVLIELKHQGTTVEKSALQQLNQGVCTHVSKPTKEVRESNWKNKYEH